MQHVQPCSFCRGIVKARDTHWHCTQCGAEWTLGMRLLTEGSSAGAALDAIFGANTPPPETLCVDTIYQMHVSLATCCRCRLRIYRCDGIDVVILTELADDMQVSVSSVIAELVRRVQTDYTLDDTTLYIEHIDYVPPMFDLVDTSKTPPRWRRLTVEEVERLTGDFFGTDTDRISEYSELY